MEHCIMCGRALKSPESVFRKMGPVCYKRLQDARYIQKTLPVLKPIHLSHRNI